MGQIREYISLDAVGSRSNSMHCVTVEPFNHGTLRYWFDDDVEADIKSNIKEIDKFLELAKKYEAEDVTFRCTRVTADGVSLFSHPRHLPQEAPGLFSLEEARDSIIRWAGWDIPALRIREAARQ